MQSINDIRNSAQVDISERIENLAIDIATKIAHLYEPDNTEVTQLRRMGSDLIQLVLAKYDPRRG